MNADEMVRRLRATQEKHKDDSVLTGAIRVSDMARDCADMIESLTTQLALREHELRTYQNTIVPELREQLAASQRRERAAVEDLKKFARNIHTCADRGACRKVRTVGHAACFNCPDWSWRGPQEAEEGEGHVCD